MPPLKGKEEVALKLAEVRPELVLVAIGAVGLGTLAQQVRLTPARQDVVIIHAVVLHGTPASPPSLRTRLCTHLKS